MSWDIFVQDIPREFTSVSVIPDDFDPKPIGSRTEIIEKICEVVPNVDFTNPTWGLIHGDGYSIEVNIGDEDPLMSFAFHIRGGDQAAFVIADILDRLNLRAFDPQSDSGIFSLANGVESLRKWRAYRDRVVGDKTG